MVSSNGIGLDRPDALALNASTPESGARTSSTTDAPCTQPSPRGTSSALILLLAPAKTHATFATPLLNGG